MARPARVDMKPYTTDVLGVMQMCTVGRQTAVEIGKKAGAEIVIGKKYLYVVSKIEAYMDKQNENRLSEESEG